MESKIKIEYNQKRTAQTIDGESVGWTIGPGDESGFPTSDIVHADADTGSDTSIGEEPENPVETLHYAAAQAINEGWDILAVNGTFHLKGTVNLGGRSIYFKNAAEIESVGITLETSSLIGALYKYTDYENVTHDGIYQAEIEVDDSGAYDFNLYKNGQSLITGQDISGTVVYDHINEFPGDFEEEARDVVRTHWTGDTLYIVIFKNKYKGATPGAKHTRAAFVFKLDEFDALDFLFDVELADEFTYSPTFYRGGEFILGVDYPRFFIHSDVRDGSNYTGKFDFFNLTDGLIAIGAFESYSGTKKTYPSEGALLPAIYRDSGAGFEGFWPVPFADEPTGFDRASSYRGVMSLSEWFDMWEDLDETGFPSSYIDFAQEYMHRMELYYNHRQYNSATYDPADFRGPYNGFRMNNVATQHDNPSVTSRDVDEVAGSLKTTVGITPYGSAESDCPPYFYNGNVYNLTAENGRSIVSDGLCENCESNQITANRRHPISSIGTLNKSIMSGGLLGHYSDNAADETKNSLIIDCDLATEGTKVKHSTIHKCVYACKAGAVIEDSIIAFCTGQYLTESEGPVTITRSVIREALNQNLVPPDSTLSLVKISDPFFKSAIQPFDLHLKSIFGNYPVNSPAIGLSLTPSIHNAAIMREAGAYDDFYAAAETWESLTIDAPWTLPITAEREVSSNKLADGRQTVGALSSPSAVLRLRWLALTSQAIQAIQSLIWADSMKVRIYFNPVSKPDVYLEGYIEPKTKIGPPVAPVVNVAEGVELTFKTQLPAGDLHGFL